MNSHLPVVLEEISSADKGYQKIWKYPLPMLHSTLKIT